ncbi:MAG TPA: hypothetical protein VGM23_01630 [Armatimonadota bacterium]|jgi:hypothetical protein
MRYICFFFLLMAVSAGFAAEITGTVLIKGPLRGDVIAGYVAMTSRDECIDNIASITIGGGGAVSATCTTYKPRSSSISWEPKKGLSFRHTALPTGRYLIYLKYCERYLDWKIVEIEEAKTSLKTTLEINLEQASTLQFDITKGAGRYRICLIPLTDNGRAPLSGADLSFGMGFPIKVDAQGNTFFFPQIKAGQYSVILERAESCGTRATGITTSYTNLGTWTIVVKDGTAVRYALP